MLMMFNLDIEARLIEKLIDFADQARCLPRLLRHRLVLPSSFAGAPSRLLVPRPALKQDGDGTIDYAEFARVMTAEDLKAFDLSKLGLVKEVKVFRKGLPVLRPGVTAAEIRDAQQTIKSRINTKCARRTAHRYGGTRARAAAAALDRPPLTPFPPPLLQVRRQARPAASARSTATARGRPTAPRCCASIKIYAPSSRDEVLENVVDFGDYDGEGEVRGCRPRRSPAAAALAPLTPHRPPSPRRFRSRARVVTTDDIPNMKKRSAVEVKTNKYGEVEEAVDHRREIDKQCGGGTSAHAAAATRIPR